jgi:hypothetical protein
MASQIERDKIRRISTRNPRFSRERFKIAARRSLTAGQTTI